MKSIRNDLGSAHASAGNRGFDQTNVIERTAVCLADCRPLGLHGGLQDEGQEFAVIELRVPYQDVFNESSDELSNICPVGFVVNVLNADVGVPDVVQDRHFANTVKRIRHS